VDGTHYAMHSQVLYPSPLAHRVQNSFKLMMIIRALSDSDIAVRRKAAFLLNSLLIPSTPVATTRAPGTRIQGGPAQPGETVHPNSHASMVADPTSTDTAPETLRAVRAHGLLPVIVRELTEPTPYGPDGDEGDGCDADLEEKLMRCVV
jgi:hsp70-interacting protein